MAGFNHTNKHHQVGEGTGIFPQFIIIKHQLSDGSNGGTFTSGAWQTRPLNTLEIDQTNRVSLVNNRFTLSGGLYYVEARALAFSVNSHKTRIFNVTSGQVALTGTTSMSRRPAGGEGATETTTQESMTIGTMRVIGSQTFELQHQCGLTQTTDGYGTPTTFTTLNEQYALVVLMKMH